MNGVLNQYNFVDYDEQNENFSNIVHYNERIYAASHSKMVIHFQKKFNYTIKKGVIRKGYAFFCVHLIALPNKHAKTRLIGNQRILE